MRKRFTILAVMFMARLLRAWRPDNREIVSHDRQIGKLVQFSNLASGCGCSSCVHLRDYALKRATQIASADLSRAADVHHAAMMRRVA